MEAAGSSKMEVQNLSVDLSNIIEMLSVLLMCVCDLRLVIHVGIVQRNLVIRVADTHIFDFSIG
jgi:hypothetical protein